MLSRGIWKYIPGLAAGLIVAGLIFLPFALAGTADEILQRAYLGSVGHFSYAAMNAGNLWMALRLNFKPDDVGLFGISFLTLRNISIFLFLGANTFLFLSSLREKRPEKMWQLSILAALTFFMLLTEMHERYCFPAAALAVMWLICDFRKWGLVLAIILSVFLNIQFTIPIQGLELLFFLSFFFLFLYAVLNLHFLEIDFSGWIRRPMSSISKMWYLPGIAFIGIFVLLALYAGRG